MKVEITLPDLGEDANDEAQVSQWFVEVGATVNEGDDLIEMTTDKAAFNVPSPQSGALVEKKVESGDDVNVGDVIAIFEV